MALWFDEMQRQKPRMQAAAENVAVGKISGAVGTFAYIPPFVEEYVCAELGLRPAPVSSQIVQRDIYAEFFCAMAQVGCSLEKFSTEIRHLMRTEVSEVSEYFSPGQKGSSAMPHKKNPILSENVSGLARLLRANALAAMENVALWHERDISHSSVERVIGPDSTIVLDFMLARFTGLLKKLLVYPENHAGEYEQDRRYFLLAADTAGADAARRVPGRRLPAGAAKRPCCMGKPGNIR